MASSPPLTDPAPLPDLAPGRRFLATLTTWVLIYASQPGFGRPDGFGHTAFVALVPWAYYSCRPGPRAFLADWAACALGVGGMSLWMHHLLPWLLIPMTIIPGFWMALGGVALRRMAHRYPLALAVPTAWMMAELLRWLMPAPLSFGWWRLGLFAHDTDWLIGSARVWGTWGLTWVFAAFCGWVADLLRLRRLGPERAMAFPHSCVHVLGLGPLALAFALCLSPAPATEPGPRVLIVQPGIEQAIKAFGTDPLQELYRDAVDLTHEGLQSMEEPPDLVAWGESMLYFSLPDEGVLEAQRLGMGTLEHAGWTLDADKLARNAAGVATFVEGVLLGRVDPLTAGRGRWAPALNQMAGAPWHADALRGVGVLPVGTSFLTGLITWVVDGDVIRKQNSAALWGPEGPPRLASKVHLVPGAEQADPYTSMPFVLAALRKVGGYVPDFVPAERAGVLSLDGRDGRSWAMGVSICYDNVFDDPYREPLERGEVDFFCILSNEAWYKRSVEMDHLVAMTRMKAVAVGRSVVRATNSGISIVVDPGGETVAVLEDGEGKRKMARGTLGAQVPVPLGGMIPGIDRPGKGSHRTFWARTGRFQPAFWALLVVLLVVYGGRGVTGASGRVRPTHG